MEKFGLDIELGEPFDISPILMTFLLIHIGDFLLYQSTCNTWDMWKVIDPNERSKLWMRDTDQGSYWAAVSKYLLLYAVRVALMSAMFWYIIPYKLC